MSSSSRSSSKSSDASVSASPPRLAPVTPRAAAKVKVFKTLRREISAALEQVWPNAYVIVKVTPVQPGSVPTGPAEIFAINVGPGLFRTLDKLDDIGLTPSALTTEDHARALTAADLKRFNVSDRNIDALNFWAYKAFGARKVVNDLYGQTSDVRAVKGPMIAKEIKTSKLEESLRSVVDDYLKTPSIPLRDAAFILSSLTPRQDGTSPFTHYNDILAKLRQDKYSAGYVHNDHQWIVFSHALHAWLGAGEFEIPNYRETRLQSAAFFDALNWNVVSAAHKASVDDANAKAMAKFKKQRLSSAEAQMV